MSVTDLARRILRPKQEGAELTAKREAVLKPRIFGEFLRRYEGNAFPRQDIALNVLEDLGVPREKASEVLERIDASARSVGFVEVIKGKNYITLQGTAAPNTQGDENESQQNGIGEDEVPERHEERSTVPPPAVQPRGTAVVAAIADDQRRKRVFITHGQNRDLVEPIKKLLEYGELEPVVSVDRQS